MSLHYIINYMEYKYRMVYNYSQYRNIMDDIGVCMNNLYSKHELHLNLSMDR